MGQAEVARLGELRLVATEERLEARLDLGHQKLILRSEPHTDESPCATHRSEAKRQLFGLTVAKDS